MVLELIWVTGEVVCIVALLFGACLVLMEVEPFLGLFGKKSMTPALLSPKDLQLIKRLSVCGPNGYSLCGNGVIDRGHQALFDGVNVLRNVILRGGTADEAKAIINTLLCDMSQHFKNEEAILVAAKYPETANHAAQHRELIDGASSMVRKIHADRLAIGEFCHLMIREVLGTHELEADQKFIPYLDNCR